MAAPGRLTPIAYAGGVNDARVGEPATRRPDASMDLLNGILRDALDPDYAAVAAREIPPRPRRTALLGVTAAIGLLFALAASLTMRAAPAALAERERLVESVRRAEADQDALRDRVAQLSRENADLQARAGGLDEATRDRATQLALVDGASAVRGTGIVLTLDDGQDAAVEGNAVVDADLRVTVNGLWQAGAEAVAINGHRLSSRTAIRGAGQAITVDYRSLTRPYVIEAVGDGRELEARFRAGPAGTWSQSLHDNYGMRFDIQLASDLTLPADPGLDVSFASVRER